MHLKFRPSFFLIFQGKGRGRTKSRRPISNLILLLKFILLGLFLLIGLPYAWYPIYDFSESQPFSGSYIHNPYQGVDSSSWLSANFHAHTKSWMGITNGKGTEAELRAVYDSLGYDIVGISNYHKVSESPMHDSIGFNVYEHGYGLLKYHYLVAGSPKVYWFEGLLFQPLSLRQYLIDLLGSEADLLIVNHPSFSRAMNPADLTLLEGYSALEVVNRYGNSFSYWDSVLSAGKPVFLVGSDDAHNSKDLSEVARKVTFVRASKYSDSIYSSIKKGLTYVLELEHPEKFADKRALIHQNIRPVSIQVRNDTLLMALNQTAKSIRFIGQNGRERLQVRNKGQAVYPIQPSDTYIRTEVESTDGSRLHFNPVFRYSSHVPQGSPAKLNVLKTNLKRGFFVLVFMALLLVLHRQWIRSTKLFSFELMTFSAKPTLHYLLVVSTLIRLFLAHQLELGNDEVYYLSYAKYPDLSHFDHPPAVGWLIQLFTLDFRFSDSLFIRFSSVLFGSINTLLLFHLGLKLKNEFAGLFAAFLYTCSIYAFVITGIFILPDTPQVFFWISSLFFLVKAFDSGQLDKKSQLFMLLSGLSIGLAMISKYTSVFLWFAALAFVVLRARHWLKSPTLYLALLLSFLILSPVLLWNLQNDFISFRFQTERVAFLWSSIRFDRFGTELVGQIFYSNPINWVLYFSALWVVFRSPRPSISNPMLLLLLSSIPIISIFLFFALFKNTLPHWSSPGYSSLLLFSALVFSDSFQAKKRVYQATKASAVFLFFVLFVGYLQVNHGLFRRSYNPGSALSDWAKEDPTADIYGWKIAGNRIAKRLELENDSLPFVHFKWFPAAHIEHYICGPMQRKQYVIGNLQNTHKYHWIHRNDSLPMGSNAWYATNSKYYTAPEMAFGSQFNSYQPQDTLPIYRDGEVVNYIFLYKCLDFQGVR